MPRRGTISASRTSTKDDSRTRARHTKRRSRSIRRTSSFGRTTICSKKSMTVRNVATIVSLTLLAFVSGCTNFFEVPIETPLSPKMDVTAFRRVLVAGFISGGTDDVDANLETVRLLRSQLRSKSGLRVIEADVLPLAELAADKAKTAPANSSGPSESTETSANGNLPKVASDVQTMAPQAQAPAPATVSQNAEAAAKIRNAKDLE